ncbi:hypothetical protein M758_UG305500 [Ceratodon purpureus]|uniref:Uncharacterized protein n=1 Tax=Ceratodon purpureus TaxID=3225 RepID=A0A8T0IZ97_CERPU|nr:hypothetical protein KC19_2G226200 [Ceratodon purpureus]KAG0597029.1 hypothetical protein M758_UG305500 [Ceratodon purpureus]
MSDLPDIVTHFIMHSLSEEENEAREGASTEIVDTPKEEEKRIDNVVETREEGVETDKPNSACNSRGVYNPSSQRGKSSMTASNEHVVAVDDEGNREGRSDRLPTAEKDYGGRSLKRRAVDVREDDRVKGVLSSNTSEGKVLLGKDVEDEGEDTSFDRKFEKYKKHCAEADSSSGYRLMKLTWDEFNEQHPVSESEFDSEDNLDSIFFESLDLPWPEKEREKYWRIKVYRWHEVQEIKRRKKEAAATNTSTSA